MRPYVDLNQALVDLARKGPTPDHLMTEAKNGIDLSDLLKEAYSLRRRDASDHLAFVFPLSTRYSDTADQSSVRVVPPIKIYRN